jgi:hypothetical protein
MTNPNIQVDGIVREMTEEEILDYQNFQLEKIDLEAKESSRNSALAKLAALGLTEEEIAAL